MKALKFVISALALVAIGPAFAAAPPMTGPAAIPVIVPPAPGGPFSVI